MKENVEFYAEFKIIKKTLQKFNGQNQGLKTFAFFKRIRTLNTDQKLKLKSKKI